MMILLLCSNMILAQGQADNIASTQKNRNFDTQKIQDFKTSEDFKYINKSNHKNTIMEWLKSRISKFLDWLFGTETSKEYTNNFFDVVKWIFIITGVLFVMANILGVEFTQLFTRKHDIKENIFNEVLEENINELNFDSLIDKHLKGKNYRYVVRLYYLKALKNLSDAEMINWQPYKTNREYFYELQDQSTQKAFGNLTSLFNHIWYGHFEVDELKLNDYVNSFEDFNNNINLKKIA